MTITFRITNTEAPEQKDVLRVRVYDPLAPSPLDAIVVPNGESRDFTVHKRQSLILEHGHRAPIEDRRKKHRV